MCLLWHLAGELNTLTERWHFAILLSFRRKWRHTRFRITRNYWIKMMPLWTLFVSPPINAGSSIGHMKRKGFWFTHLRRFHHFLLIIFECRYSIRGLSASQWYCYAIYWEHFLLLRDLTNFLHQYYFLIFFFLQFKNYSYFVVMIIRKTIPLLLFFLLL